MERQSYFIDWLDAYRCIGVQGKWQSCFVDLQIEPDDPVVFSLREVEQLYRAVEVFLRLQDIKKAKA